MVFSIWGKIWREWEMFMTNRVNLCEDYPKLLVFSIQQKVPANKPALFQWWLKAVQKQKEKGKEQRNWIGQWLKSLSYDIITPSCGKNNRQTQLTWFTAPRAPLKFWGAISAMYTGTYKIINKVKLPSYHLSHTTPN